MTLLNSIQKTEILKWTQELCRCLGAQYRNYSLRYVMDSQNGNDKYLQEMRKLRMMKSVSNSLSHQVKHILRSFRMIIAMVSMRVQGFTLLLGKDTGEVYKPASWKAASAKHVRFDMRDQNQREYMYANCDWESYMVIST